MQATKFSQSAPHQTENKLKVPLNAESRKRDQAIAQTREESSSNATFSVDSFKNEKNPEEKDELMIVTAL